MTMDMQPAALFRLARIGGALYLLVITSGLLGELVRASLLVAGDAAASLAHIRASALPWRLAIAANLLHLACSVALAVILFVLLRPVQRDLALLAVLLNLVAITLEAAGKLFLLPALWVAGDAPYLQSFDARQLEALAYAATRLHAHGFNISLLFFGFECLLLGWLIRRSTLLPGLLGVLLQLAGACYVGNSLLVLLAPALASVFLLVPCLLAELALAAWLLAKGVRVSGMHHHPTPAEAQP